jgi:hypothetical protein
VLHITKATSIYNMGCETIISVLFTLQHTVKVYHWQTTSYARHKATCDLLGGLDPLIDEFVEVYMGRYGRPVFKGGFQITIEELTDETADSSINNWIVFLKKELPKYVKASDTDLLNIRDEMLGILNKTLYLFTLY